MKLVGVHDVGFGLEGSTRSQQVTPRVGVVGLDDLVVERLTDLVDELFGLLIERLLAVHTEVLLTGRLFLTARAGERRDGFGLVNFDVDAVGTRNLSGVRVAEDRDVSPGDVASATPAVMVFEVCLRNALGGEMRRRGLSEVRGRDGALDADSSGGFLDEVTNAVVRDTVGLRELRDEPVVVPAGMDVEPLADVRNTWNQDGRATSGLPVERHLETISVVFEDALSELVEFVRSRTEVPRERDDGSVAMVVTAFNHREDVFVPSQHVAGVGSGIVVLRIAAGNPLDGVGHSVTLGGEFAEASQRDTVVLVGLGRAVLLGVNPRDDGLGGLLVVEGVGDSSDAFGDGDQSHQILLVSVVAELRGAEQSDLIREREQRVGVVVGDVVGLLKATSKALDGDGRVVGHSASRTDVGHVKVGCGAHPGHTSIPLHAQAPTAGGTWAADSHELDRLAAVSSETRGVLA